MAIKNIEDVKNFFRKNWAGDSTAPSKLIEILEQHAPHNVWTQDIVAPLSKHFDDAAAWLLEQQQALDIPELEFEHLCDKLYINFDNLSSHKNVTQKGGIKFRGITFPVNIIFPNLEYVSFEKCSFKKTFSFKGECEFLYCSFSKGHKISCENGESRFDLSRDQPYKNLNISGDRLIISGFSECQVDDSEFSASESLSIKGIKLKNCTLKSPNNAITNCSVLENLIFKQTTTNSVQITNTTFKNTLPDMRDISALRNTSYTQNVTWGPYSKDADFLKKCYHLEHLLGSINELEERQKIKALTFLAKLDAETTPARTKLIYNLYKETSDFGQDYVRPLIWLFGVFTSVFAISLLHFICVCSPLADSLQQASELAFKSILGPLRIGFSFEFGPINRPPYGLYIISWLASAFATYLWFSAFMVINRHVRLPSVK